MTNQPPEPEQQPEQDHEPLERLSETWFDQVLGMSKKSANKLIQWGPLFTITSFLISAWQQQEWFSILLLFPPAIILVLWGIYAEGFLERLWEVLPAKGKEDVNNLKTLLQQIQKAVAETIRWQLAGTDDKYLKCQGNECAIYKTEGLKHIFRPSLRAVFVSLELSGEFVLDSANRRLPLWPGFSQQQQIMEQRKEGLSIWVLLQKAHKEMPYRSLIILAWGGYGKTTLLRHITYIYTRKLESKRAYNAPKLLPVLLYLRKWQELIARPDAPNLATLIEKYHLPDLPEGSNLNLPPNWAANHLRKGTMLVMLDGFDEVKEDWRNDVAQWIGKHLKNYPQTFFILTSRPAGYRQYNSDYQPNIPLYIKRFNPEQQERFIQRWYLSWKRHLTSNPDQPAVKAEAYEEAASLYQQLKPEEGKRNPLRDFASNPLLLNMIVNLHSSYPDKKLPQRRADLYKSIIRLLLGDRPLARQIDMPLEVNESQQVLQSLALFMTIANITKLEPAQLERKLQSYLTAIDESVSGSIFLNKIEQVSELLVQVDDTYEFAHKSFQEYLAACEIKRTQQEDLLFENWQEQWWEAIILLYVAQLKNPNLFLCRLADIPDSKATKLAYKCLQETCRKIDDDLAQELEAIANKVQAQRYQQLEKYLKNGQWREADIETYRLMRETVNKEETQLLESEDIENFSCEDLRILDKLWVSNSNGKLGFSVQKKIYFALGGGGTGGTGGAKEYNSDVWKEFGDRVGWYSKEGGRWFNDMKYGLLDTIPRGHLPGAEAARDGVTAKIFIVCLEQIIVNCGL